MAFKFFDMCFINKKEIGSEHSNKNSDQFSKSFTFHLDKLEQ